MTRDIVDGILLFLSLVIPLIGVFIFCFLDRFVDKKRKNIFMLLVILVISHVLQNYIEYFLTEYISAVTARLFVSVYGYSVRPVIIALFIHLVSPNKKHIPVSILCAINFLVYTTSFYSNWCIGFTPDNHFHAGPLRYTCLIISILLLIYNIVIVILEFKKEKKKNILIPIFLTGLVVAGILIDIFGYSYITHRVDYITIMISIATLFYYVWLHIQFVYRHESDLMAQQKIQLALSQIKPHFIYNTLNAIQDIEGMPENAQNAIVDFSKYLRENLDFLTASNLIPFSKELEHVRKYVNLEKLRFEDKINVVFNVEETEFLIPSLSLQMVVENAIKHGITKKYEGGTVTINSYKNDNKIYIVVEDDGVGFDVNKVIGETHLGFKNSRERLRHFVNGDLVIESEIGNGTKVTIIIPDKKEIINNEDNNS
ncbi:MAG: histidine kinase [Acholeplasmatales bacterium]|nr:histidine kinase [Acholeplasmatales bacterium]